MPFNSTTIHSTPSPSHYHASTPQSLTPNTPKCPSQITRDITVPFQLKLDELCAPEQQKKTLEQSTYA